MAQDAAEDNDAVLKNPHHAVSGGYSTKEGKLDSGGFCSYLLLFKLTDLTDCWF